MALIPQGHIRKKSDDSGVYFSSWFPCQHLKPCVDECCAVYGPVRDRIISTSCWLVAALLARHFHVQHRGRARGHPSSIPARPSVKETEECQIAEDPVLVCCRRWNSLQTFSSSSPSCLCSLSDINNEQWVRLWGTLFTQYCSIFQHFRGIYTLFIWNYHFFAYSKQTCVHSVVGRYLYIWN